MKIWIISDTHFGHDNMIPYCGRPENFDDLLIKNWNKIVQPEDLVIHLGDVLMGQNSQARLPSILAALPGKKILARGNHDAEKKWGTNVGFMEAGFDFVCDYFVYDKYAFSHCPLTPLPKQANFHWDKEVSKNIHGHFHNKPPTDDSGNFQQDYYDPKYFWENRNKYQLVSIEPDILRPFSLEEVLEMKKNGGENI